MRIIGICGPSYDAYISEDNHYFANTEELINFLSKPHLETYNTIFLEYNDMISITNEDDILRHFFIDFYQGEITQMFKEQFELFWTFTNKADLMIWENDCNSDAIYNSIVEIAKEVI